MRESGPKRREHRGRAAVFRGRGVTVRLASGALHWPALDDGRHPGLFGAVSSSRGGLNHGPWRVRARDRGSVPEMAWCLRQRVSEVHREGQTVVSAGPLLPCTLAGAFPDATRGSQGLHGIGSARWSSRNGRGSAAVRRALSRPMGPAAGRQGNGRGTPSPSDEIGSLVGVLARRVVLQMWVGGVRPREAFPDHGSGGRERGSSSPGDRGSEETAESRPGRRSPGGEFGPWRAPIDRRHPGSGEPRTCHEGPGVSRSRSAVRAPSRRKPGRGDLAGDRGVRGSVVSERRLGG